MCSKLLILRAEKNQNPNDGKVICGPDGQQTHDEGEMHEGVHREGEHHVHVQAEGDMQEQVHSVGGRHERAQVEGELHVQAQGVGGSHGKAKERRKNVRNKHQDGIKPKKRIMETVGVMFVDQTVLGGLAKEMQKAEDIIAEMVGYRVRIVESSGTQLCRLLPNTNPWAGQYCGRPECFTCTQEMRRYRTAAREKFCMNLHVRYAILTERKDTGRRMMTRRRP